MPNFTLLDLSRPEIASLMAAMLQARAAVEHGRGGIRRNRLARNGGPTCWRTRAPESAIVASTWRSSTQPIGSLMSHAR